MHNIKSFYALHDEHICMYETEIHAASEYT